MPAQSYLGHLGTWELLALVDGKHLQSHIFYASAQHESPPDVYQEQWKC